MRNMLLETGRKMILVIKYLTELFSSVLWKVELASDETGYRAEVSKQSIEGMAWFLLTTYSKMHKESYELRKELQKGTRTERFGKFSAYPYCKKLDSML